WRQGLLHSLIIGDGHAQTPPARAVGSIPVVEHLPEHPRPAVGAQGPLDVLYDGVALTANGCLLVCQRHVRGHLAERIRLGLSLANDWNRQRCDDGIDSHHYVQEPPELLGGWVHQPAELGGRGIELVVIEIANMRKVWLDLTHPEPVSIVWAERGIIGLASQDRLAV